MSQPMAVQRPGTITLIVVLMWINAIIEIIGGVILILASRSNDVITGAREGDAGGAVPMEDLNASTLLWAGIFSILFGLITILLANGLKNGSNGVRDDGAEERVGVDGLDRDPDLVDRAGHAVELTRQRLLQAEQRLTHRWDRGGRRAPRSAIPVAIGAASGRPDQHSGGQRAPRFYFWGAAAWPAPAPIASQRVSWFQPCSG